MSDFPIYAVGSKVCFTNPEDEFEQSLEMFVVEDRGDRVLVRTMLEGFAENLMPTAVYLKSDLKPGF